MSVLHRAVDAMMAKLVPSSRPMTITCPDGAIHVTTPGVVIPSVSLSLSHKALMSHRQVYFTPPTMPPVRLRDLGRPALRDLGRPALAAALRELATVASPAARFELRAIAEELDTRCPDCHRHLTRDPWRHCATCEPTTPGVNS